MAVGGEHDPHGNWYLPRVPTAACHAPADKFGAIAHGTWLSAAPLPAKCCSTLLVAFAQGLAAVRMTCVLIAIRITAYPQRHRVDLELDRQLIHRGFERVDGGCSARRTHVAWRRQIQPR